MTMARGAISNALAPGYRRVVFETYKERPTEGNKFMNMKTSERAYEEDFPIAGFGTLLVKGEGEGVAYQDAIQGLTKRYTWTTYALGFRITEEMFEDDLYGIMGGKMSKALGRSARNNFEVVAASVLNNAFSTSYVGFETSKALCSLTHATLRGQAVANRPTSDTDISLIALQAAVEHYHSLVDEAGLPMVIVPKTVIYNPGDHWIVSQLLKSQKLPGTNYNDVNQIANEGLLQGLPGPSHYLSDADAWFVLGDYHDMNYFDRRKPKFTNTDDFETGDAKYKLTRRNGAGFSDWRGVYGSPGV